MLPRILFKDLDFFSQEASKTDITQLLQVDCTHESVLVYSRYIKKSRKLSQTPWNIKDPDVEEKFSTKVIGSVQDTIAESGLRELFKPKDGVMMLHAAGREDIDVRMLGTGRPFVMEIVNPTKIKSGSEQVNSLKLDGPLIICKEFKIVDKDFYDRLKEMESTKAKSYASVVYCPEGLTQDDCDKLNKIKDLDVE
jgi:tRNA pseudouridine synthase 10